MRTTVPTLAGLLGLVAAALCQLSNGANDSLPIRGGGRPDISRGRGQRQQLRHAVRARTTFDGSWRTAAATHGRRGRFLRLQYRLRPEVLRLWLRLWLLEGRLR